jgi:hypothetical protein
LGNGIWKNKCGGWWKGLENEPHKVMAFGGTAQSGEPLRIHCTQLGLWSALTKVRGRDATEGKTPVWGSSQPAYSLGTQSIYYLFIYLFSQVHRIELTSSWHIMSSLVHARSFYLYFVPFCSFITHPWSHPSLPHIGTQSSVLNLCPSNPPFMCLFTYVYLWKIYGIVF